MNFFPLSCACSMEGSGNPSIYLLAVGFILMSVAFCRIIKPANLNHKIKSLRAFFLLGVKIEEK